MSIPIYTYTSFYIGKVLLAKGYNKSPPKQYSNWLIMFIMFFTKASLIHL